MGLKELIHSDSLLSDRVRLAIMAALASASEPLDFNTLLETLELTKGNLSSHMRKLEAGNFVEIRKEFVDRKPRTTYRCTDAGREALSEYLSTIEKILQSTNS